MGIKASATCVMNFDDATGFLIGPAEQGSELHVHLYEHRPGRHRHSGSRAAELSYQGALAYARERRSMRALSGKSSRIKSPTA